MLTVEREEAKQRRLQRITIHQKVLMKKFEATKLKQILRMLRKLSLEDLEMDVDVVERKATELMEVNKEMLELGLDGGGHELDDWGGGNIYSTFQICS